MSEKEMLLKRINLVLDSELSRLSKQRPTDRIDFILQQSKKKLVRLLKEKINTEVDN